MVYRAGNRDSAASRNQRDFRNGTLPRSWEPVWLLAHLTLEFESVVLCGTGKSERKFRMVDAPRWSKGWESSGLQFEVHEAALDPARPGTRNRFRSSLLHLARWLLSAFEFPFSKLQSPLTGRLVANGHSLTAVLPVPSLTHFHTQCSSRSPTVHLNRNLWNIMVEPTTTESAPSTHPPPSPFLFPHTGKFVLPTQQVTTYSGACSNGGCITPPSARRPTRFSLVPVHWHRSLQELTATLIQGPLLCGHRYDSSTGQTTGPHLHRSLRLLVHPSAFESTSLSPLQVNTFSDEKRSTHPRGERGRKDEMVYRRRLPPRGQARPLFLLQIQPSQPMRVQAIRCCLAGIESSSFVPPITMHEISVDCRVPPPPLPW